MFSRILRPPPIPFEADFERETEIDVFPCVLRETLRGRELSHPENWEAAFKRKDELRKRLIEAGLPADIAVMRSIKNVPVRDRRHLAILGMKLRSGYSY
jgi:hypothetical protein